MGLLGWIYGAVWRQAMLRRGAWASFYVILAALSIYLVMQTMEAVIFRTLELGLPCWLAWKWATRTRGASRRVRHVLPRYSWKSTEEKAGLHA